MRILATIELAVFFLLAFGLRTLLHWRATGRSGFVGLRPGARAVEMAAGVLLVVALALAPCAIWIGEPLWRRGQALGAAVALGGIALTFVAQLQMGSSWRIGVEPGECTKLVTRGAFAAVRNPIFSAMLLVAVGLALAVPTPLALALPPVLLLALELQVRFVEEPHLLRAHGEPYLRWASRTGRFVPRIGRLALPR
ncbi:MAG: isoprenylcysteine carboxylmethyltransferase family protein [Myxococcales bacterium]|nr:isoprenylcysteine carboxylmethyltransferase family protein [Myxococcales bacterium]